MALTMDDAITIKDDRRPLSLTNEMQQVQEKGDLDNWRCRMKRKILASTLGLVILLSACSAEINSNRKDVSSLAENASESTTMAVIQERENTTENETVDDVSDVSEVSNVPETSDTPEGKTTLVLGGIGLRDDTLASLVNNFNAENTKYTVVIDDYAEIHSRGSRQRLSCKQSCLPVMLRISTISETICFLRFRGSPPDFYMIWIH